MTQDIGKAPLNSGRQIELDIVRGLAVFFMVLIHIQEYYLHADLTDHPLSALVDFLGGIPAAPVFMFLMGTGVVYSRSNDLPKAIRRGLLLILAGYLLNLFRGTLPALFQWLVFKEPSAIGLGFNQLIYVDIFQFSGLALMLLGFIKKWNIKANAILLIAFFFACLNFMTQTIETTGFIANALVGLFIGSSPITFFPFLSWIFYPLAGYLFGQSLQNCSNKNSFYAKWGISALMVTTFLFGFFALYLEQDIGLSSDYSYYHHQLIGNVIFTGFVIAWISLFHFLSNSMPEFMIRTLKRWSTHVSEIYFIHWLLIGWLIPILGYNPLGMATYWILVLIVLTSSDALALAYMQWRKK